MKKKKILFISHNASRSGAPFVLLYLMQWLKQHTDYKIGILLIEEGLLAEEFRKASDQFFTLPELIEDSKKRSLLKKITGKLVNRGQTKDDILKMLVEKIDIGSYDLVYGNTIATLTWVIPFKRIFDVKIICAIHELTFALESFHSPEILKTQLPLIDLIIAGSKAVADNMINRYEISPDAIKTVHAFIHTFITPTGKPEFPETLKIPKHAFIIGGAGSVEWRKGVDALIPLGLHLKKHHKDFQCHIVWVGADFNSPFTKNLVSDIYKAGLAEKITILENTSDYLDYISRFNVFILLSREDPFPLVSLEAAHLKKPILMFRETGGTAELIVNGGGVLVDYMDTEALGDAIVDLSRNPATMAEMGELLKREVVEKYNSGVACRKVLDILNSI